MTKMKRLMGFVAAMCCLLACLTGCGGKEIASVETVPTQPSGALGRYVESKLDLPEGKYAEDMVLLADGRLRVVMVQEDGSAAVYTTGADRLTWEETMQIPEAVPASGALATIALSPDGTMFCHTIRKADENGNYGYFFWVIDPDRTLRELPITYADVDEQAGYLSTNADFTESGRLMAQFNFEEVRQIDLATGALGDNVNELEEMLLKIGCAGEDTYMMGWRTASANIGGQTATLDNEMGRQIVDSLLDTEGTTPQIVFWQNADGYVFYTTHDGLFSYIPGGSITEELVSGARSSLGDPTLTPLALTGTEDGSFYVLAKQGAQGSVLLHYVYDETAPTVSDTRLRIYSLYQDDNLQQMVSQYQVANPQVTVDLEVGLTGDTGVTEADAIRTLNTQILAGNGPDLLCLDGFNLNTYLEKGILADLSGVLDQGEQTLTQVTKCYAQDGKVCAVPTTFAIPAVYGPGHIVSQIQDWDSLVAATTQAGAERPDALSVLTALVPTMTADCFYDACSASWMNADGTLNGEKLTAYYAAMQRIFALDAPLQELYAAYMEEMEYTPGVYTGLNGAFSIVAGDFTISFGTLDGMLQWAFALSGNCDLEGYATRPLEVEGSGVFLPRRIMGMLTTSRYPQAAEDFLRFMLSEEVQAQSLSTGFPVNSAVFEKELSEDRVIDSWLSSSDGEGNVVSYQSEYPDAQNRQALREWVANMTTPALTDRTVRNLVMAQMDACLTGKITPEAAAQEALGSLNLYLSE